MAEDIYCWITRCANHVFFVYLNQPDTQRFMIEFIHNIWRHDMFRTSMVHPQKRLQAVCCKFGMW